MTPSNQANTRLQTLIGACVALLGLGMAVGALSIPSAAGYAGVGPNFLPWLVSIALLICGGFMVYEARTGGFRKMSADVGDDKGVNTPVKPYWAGFAWMSAGLLANAALITTLGFILSCTLCFVLAARGMRNAEGQASGGARTWIKDGVTGVLIATPVYWMFTKFLAINLPGLTQTGWL